MAMANTASWRPCDGLQRLEALCACFLGRPADHRRRRRSGIEKSTSFCKLATRLVPKDCRIAMIATAMQAAINPYSIAVAPESSLRNLTNRSRMLTPFCFCGPPKCFTTSFDSLKRKSDGRSPGNTVCKSPLRLVELFHANLLLNGESSPISRGKTRARSWPPSSMADARARAGSCHDRPG
jgi:hypothetical protein